MGTNEHYLSTKCDPSSKMNELKQMPGLKKKNKEKKKTLTGQPMKISNLKNLKMPFSLQNYFFMLTAL